MTVKKEKYMTVKEYALKFNKAEKTIYNWIASGKIPKKNIKIILHTTLIKV